MTQNKNEMIVLGITGGIGSGKSLVLHKLEQLPDTVILEADLLAHRLMSPGHRAYREIVSAFGTGILSPDGTIDRAVLGQMVFRQEELLEQLNHIVHPEVKRNIRERIRRNRAKGTRLFVIEAALLIQDGYQAICDEIWYVHTKKEIRIRRLLDSRGGTPEKWEAVFASQPEDEYFLQHADVVLKNDLDEAAMELKLNQELSRLLLKF